MIDETVRLDAQEFHARVRILLELDSTDHPLGDADFGAKFGVSDDAHTILQPREQSEAEGLNDGAFLGVLGVGCVPKVRIFHGEDGHIAVRVDAQDAGWNFVVGLVLLDENL
jgi:hypothetical protein